METFSKEFELELQRRVSDGAYPSVEELLKDALRALDHAQNQSREWLRKEILRGMDGEFVDLDDAEWDTMEQEAIEILESRRKA